MLLTPVHPLKDAIRFKTANVSSTWLLLARTTAWTTADGSVGQVNTGLPVSDTNPPVVDPAATSIPSPFCAIQAQVRWVQADSGGAIPFVDLNDNDTNYTELTTTAAVLANPPGQILLTGRVVCSTILALSLGIANFRQCGFTTDLIPTSGNESATFLSASQISYVGDFECTTNFQPIPLIAGSNFTLGALIPYEG